MPNAVKGEPDRASRALHFGLTIWVRARLATDEHLEGSASPFWPWMISANFPPPTFQPDRSGGSELARLLVAEPRPLWLLDEPTGKYQLDTGLVGKAGRGCQRPHQVGSMATLRRICPTGARFRQDVAACPCKG